MSRHRNIHYDEDDYDDHYDTQDDMLDDDQEDYVYNREHDAYDDQAVTQVKSVIGDSFSNTKIRKALESCRYDIERTINYLLGNYEKSLMTKEMDPSPPSPGMHVDSGSENGGLAGDGMDWSGGDQTIVIQRSMLDGYLCSKSCPLPFNFQFHQTKRLKEKPAVIFTIPMDKKDGKTTIKTQTSSTIPFKAPFSFPKPLNSSAVFPLPTPGMSLSSLAKSKSDTPSSIIQSALQSLKIPASSSPTGNVLAGFRKPTTGMSILPQISVPKISLPASSKPSPSIATASIFATILSECHKIEQKADPILSILDKPPKQEGFKFQTPSPDDAAKQGKVRKSEALKKDSKPSSRAASRQNSVEKLETKMSTFSVNEKSKAKSADVSRSSSVSSVQVSKSRKIDVLAEFKSKKRGKDNLNLVVVGHVDAGKSTLMGHLLYILGDIPERTMKKYEKESAEQRKGSFAFAWVLDATEEERNRGVTIDVAVTNFETNSKKFTLLDAPGHKDFIPNMISGTSQADVAILVIDSGMGEFEAGFELGGQTREHGLLLRSLGISQLIVAVNKLDSIDWSKDRYDYIKEKVTGFLLQAGFKTFTFVPCSGYTGENLRSRQEGALDWYKGPTLVEQMDRFTIPERPIEKPLRMSITDFFKGGLNVSVGGNVITVSGRIEAGTIQIGEAVKIMPLNQISQVKAISINEEMVKWAVAGDTIMVTLTDIDPTHLSVGFNVCDPENPVPLVQKLKAQVITFDLPIPITIGLPLVLLMNSVSESVHLIAVESQINRTTGEAIKKVPRVLTKNQAYVVELALQRPLCMETFKDCKALGRFTLRHRDVSVGAGIVLDKLG